MTVTRREFWGATALKSALVVSIGLGPNGPWEPLVWAPVPKKVHNLGVSFRGSLDGGLTLSPTLVRAETPHTEMEEDYKQRLTWSG